MVAVNTAGFHAKTQMGGHSVILDASANVLAEAGADESIITADLDLEAIHTRRTSFPAPGDRRL